MSIAKFVSVILVGIILQTNLQVTAPVSNKVEDLISRIIALEEQFGTPAGDVMEKMHRGDLMRYFTAPPLPHSVLSFFQESP
jgi:hypothetical protein